MVGKPAVRHVEQIAPCGDGGGGSGEEDDGDATAAEQDRCLKWTQQSADHYMFRYSFDPETFSFVEVDEKGDACSTRPPTRSEVPLRFGDCCSGAGGLPSACKQALCGFMWLYYVVAVPYTAPSMPCLAQGLCAQPRWVQCAH